MTIPQAQPYVGQEEAQAVSRVIESGWITEGPRCTEFSERLNKLFGADYGVFAPNGTLALVLGLLALDIGPGDEVLVPDVTFVASATAVVLAGATPVFVGVNGRNYQIDVERCTEKLTARTQAIMPVHLYGMSANMHEVMTFAGKHVLLVIEDAAQAVGVKYNSRHCGTFGDVGCFSFFADKTITTGEGGYVVCQDRGVYNKLQRLRNQGRQQRGSFTHPEIGYNFRITDLQGAMGVVQLDKLEWIIKRKRHILSAYQQELANVDQVEFLPVELSSDHVPFRIVLLCESRVSLQDHLESNGIQTRSFFLPLHKQPCFWQRDICDDQFPNAVDGYRRGVCLPVYPGLQDHQVEHICEAIKSFYG